MIEHQLSHDRSAVWAGMGTGKTSSTLTAIQIFQELVDARPQLILAPKRVAKSVWPREMQKWDHLTGEVQPILGSVADRTAALNGGLRSGNVSLFTINYENIPWLIDFLKDQRKPWPFASIKADESTKLKSYRSRQGGQRAQALSNVAFSDCDWFDELTGTPSPNGLKDLWGQAWFLDGGQRLGRSYSAYMNRWFQKGYDGFSWTPFEHSEAQIHAALRDICLSVQVQVDEPIVNKIMVELPPAARKLYNDMERAAYAEMAETNFEAVHAAAKANKLLQIASGAMYDDAKRWHEIHDAKLEALESVMNEAAGMPVLVATNFKFDTDRILRAFPKARVLDEDPATEDAWNAGKIPMLLAHPASAGHGLNLQDGGNILAFYGGDWNLEHHDQIIERIGPMRQKQSGHNRPVYVHYIMAENTMDEVVFDRRVNKRSVQDALMEAMKRIKL